MRLALTCLIAAGAGLLAGQHPRALSLSIRSIKVKAISGCQTNSLTPIKIEVLEAAWKAGKVNLAVESQLDLASIDKAKRVIREEYAASSGYQGYPLYRHFRSGPTVARRLRRVGPWVIAMERTQVD